MFLVKTDHQLTSDEPPDAALQPPELHRRRTSRTAAPRTPIEHTGDSLVRTRTFNAQPRPRVFSPTLFNELRVQWAQRQGAGRGEQRQPRGARSARAAQRVLVIGRNNFSPRETTIKRWQVADTVTWVRGAHTLKGGFDFQFDDILNFFPGNFGGAYTFAALAGVQPRRARAARASVPAEFAGPGTTGADDRAEHQRVSRSSSRTSGALQHGRDGQRSGCATTCRSSRSRRCSNPDAQLAAAGIDTSFLNTDKNNSGPRLGVAWAPAGREVRRARRLRPVLRPHAVDHGRARRTRTTASTCRRSRSPAARCRPTRTSSTSLPTGVAAAAADDLRLRPRTTRTPQRAAGERRRRMRVAAERRRVSVNYLFVKGDRTCRARPTSTSARRSPRQLHRRRTGGTLPHYQFRRRSVHELRRASSRSRARAESTLQRRDPRAATAASRRLPGAAWPTRSARSRTPCPTPPRSCPATRATTRSTRRTRRTSTPTAPPATTTSATALVVSAAMRPTALASGCERHRQALLDGWTLAWICTAQSGQPYSALRRPTTSTATATAQRHRARHARNQFRLPTQLSARPARRARHPASAARASWS